MLRIIKEFKPTWVVGENVAGFVTLGLDDALSDLETAGYKTRAFVFPACAVGTVHRRDRCFIVADFISVGLQGGTSRQVSRQREVSPQLERDIRSDRRRITGQTQSRLVRHVHGVSDGVDLYGLTKVPQLVQGRVRNRAVRIRALGNAIVPAQIYPIFEAIIKETKGEFKRSKIINVS
jgi:DNA (cytosine-5)-methyltransferase 1